MTHEPRGAAWKRHDVAHSFVEHRRRVLPFLDIQESLVLRLLRRQGKPIERFLDVGSGDGAMSELLLAEFPDARALLVDHSPPMLARAHERLGRFEGRWEAVSTDLSDPSWHDALADDAFDAAVSSYAIHHLDAAEKRRLFADLLELLAPAALFLNMDYVTVAGPMQGSFEEQMAANLVRSERDRGSARPEEEIVAELSLAFDADDEDHPDGAAEQVAWLAAAGFTDAEIHFKWGEVAVYGGARPAA
jgi:tRNA (cmo5U34)-methyltransferase